MEYTFIITMCGAGLGFLTGIHLLFKGKRAPVYLGVYLLALSVVLAEPIGSHLPFPKWIFSLFVGSSSFVLGPALYLYCLARSDKRKHTGPWNWHMAPAALFLILGALSGKPEPGIEDSTGDLALYFLFIAQLFTYLILTTRLNQRLVCRINNHISNQMSVAFIRALVYSSLTLFSFSFLSTLFGENNGNVFVASIQTLIVFIIVVIALLNTEELEQRPQREWIPPDDGRDARQESSGL